MDGGSFRAYTGVMIQENLQRLRTRLEQAPDLDAETRQRTLELVEELVPRWLVVLMSFVREESAVLMAGERESIWA